MIKKGKVVNCCIEHEEFVFSYLLSYVLYWEFKYSTWALQFNLRTETFVNTICKFEDKNNVTRSTDGIFSTKIMKMFFSQNLYFNYSF